MASSDDDGELLRRHVAGDPDAFVAYYRRNLALVLAFFLRRTSCAADGSGADVQIA